MYRLSRHRAWQETEEGEYVCLRMDDILSDGGGFGLNQLFLKMAHSNRINIFRKKAWGHLVTPCSKDE